MASILKSFKIIVFIEGYHCCPGCPLLCSRSHYQQLCLPVLAVFFSSPSSIPFLCKFSCFFVSFRILCSAILLCSLHVLLSSHLYPLIILHFNFSYPCPFVPILYREYWKIYRRPGFLAVVWFCFSPTPYTTSLPSVSSSRRQSGRLRMRDNLLMGWGGARPDDVEKAWSSVNPSLLFGITELDQGGLKGSLTRDFVTSGFHSRISFPLDLENPIEAISNFYENSRTLSQLCVQHRCGGKAKSFDREKSLVLYKSFNIVYFFISPSFSLAATHHLLSFHRPAILSSNAVPHS